MTTGDISFQTEARDKNTFWMIQNNSVKRLVEKSKTV